MYVYTDERQREEMLMVVNACRQRKDVTRSVTVRFSLVDCEVRRVSRQRRQAAREFEDWMSEQEIASSA